jgi:hypothetical protein
MLKEPAKVLDMITNCAKQTEALRKRFEDHYDLARLQPFEMGNDTGNWVSHTTNRAAYDLTNIQDMLANAKVNLGIPIDNENEQDRDTIATTERMVWGAIHLSDSVATAVPEGNSFHDGHASFMPMRGFGVSFCHIYQDDDGNFKVNAEAWDANNTYWISGTEELIFVAYRRYESADGLNEEYNLELAGDDKGLVTVYKVIDRDQMGELVVGGGSTSNPEKKPDWLVEPFDHNLGHIPVYIRPNGNRPLVVSDRHDDTIKDFGVSWASDNDKTYNLESRLLTYFLTAAERDSKEPIFITYDSNMDTTTPEIEGNPQKAGSVVFLDKAKGQDILTRPTKETARDTMIILQEVQRQLDAGSKSPVSYNEANKSGTPAAGLNLLAHISMTNIRSFMKNIQQHYEWLAHELVSQFKSGDFNEITLKGVDGQERRFEITVKPDDIDDSWEFQCVLMADLPTDEVANVGMAVQTTQGRLLSRRSAMDKYHLSDDPDTEMTLIDQEQIESIAALMARKLEKDLREKGDIEAADMIREFIEMQAEQRQQGVASQPGQRRGAMPSGTTTGNTATGERMQRLMQRMGVNPRG